MNSEGRTVATLGRREATWKGLLGTRLLGLSARYMGVDNSQKLGSH